MPLQDKTAEVGPASLCPWNELNWRMYSTQKRRGGQGKKQECTLQDALTVAKSLGSARGFRWEEEKVNEALEENSSEEEASPTTCTHCKQGDFSSEYGPRCVWLYCDRR